MRAVALLLAALSLLGLTSAVYRPVPHEPADKDVLLVQRRVYQLLWHLGQPSLHKELREIAISYQLEKHIDRFKNPEVVERFIKYYRRGYFQQRGERYSVFGKNGQLQVKALVDLLYNAVDFETFFKTAVWAREYLSEDLFAYAFAVQYLLRNDPNGVITPNPYDVIPQRYVNPDVIQKAWRAALEGKCFDKKHPYVIRINSTSCDTYRDDGLLCYYTQDVSLLAYRDLYRSRWAFWAKFEDYRQPEYIRRGDDFYYILKTILIRYYLERLSNHLPDIEPIEYKEPVCGVKSYNSPIQDLITIERRLKDIIESGYAYDSKGGKYSLRDPLSSDIFGNIVEGNADSIHREYYGSIYYMLLEYAQQLIGSCENYMVGSFFMDSPDSVFRSPLFYRVVKRVVVILDHFKDRLGPYSHKQESFTQEDFAHVPSFDRRTNSQMEDIVIGIPGVEKQLGELNINNSPGPDGIPLRFYKEYSAALAPYLACVYSESLIQRKVPSHWKKAQGDSVMMLQSFGDVGDDYMYEFELWLPGVKVLSLDVDKLVTYMEDFDFELNNVIPVPSLDEAANLMVVARQRRLNHKPFSYRVTVTSDRELQVLVRFFIGPQFNVYGKQLSLNERRHYMLYVDSFVCKLEKGKNELVRNSTQFNFYDKVSLSYDKLFQLTKTALGGKVHPHKDDFVSQYGFLDHLTIPRGWRSGMPLSAYVIVTAANHKDRSWINPSPDDFSLFPFDRPIKEEEFAVPNARFSGATVYYRDVERPIIEVESSVPNEWSSGGTVYHRGEDRPIKEAKFAVPNAWSSGTTGNHWNDDKVVAY